MADFGNHDSGDPSQQELENAIGLLDKRLLEMKVKWSRQCIFYGCAMAEVPSCQLLAMEA
jgi:hypothetical protein